MRIEIEQNEEARFAMAPMIDMVFLLLVFFMCASHLSQKQNIPLQIPTASKGVVPKERPDRWVVNIQVKRDGDGQLVLDAAGKAVSLLSSGADEVAVEDLAAELKARLAENPNVKVYLRADVDSPHREVKKVMNALAQVGVDDFIFGVFKPNEGGGAPANAAAGL